MDAQYSNINDAELAAILHAANEELLNNEENFDFGEDLLDVNSFPDFYRESNNNSSNIDSNNSAVDNSGSDFLQSLNGLPVSYPEINNNNSNDAASYGNNFPESESSLPDSVPVFSDNNSSNNSAESLGTASFESENSSPDMVVDFNDASNTGNNNFPSDNQEGRFQWPQGVTAVWVDQQWAPRGWMKNIRPFLQSPGMDLPVGFFDPPRESMVEVIARLAEVESDDEVEIVRQEKRKAGEEVEEANLGVESAFRAQSQAVAPPSPAKKRKGQPRSKKSTRGQKSAPRQILPNLQAAPTEDGMMGPVNPPTYPQRVFDKPPGRRIFKLPDGSRGYYKLDPESEPQYIDPSPPPAAMNMAYNSHAPTMNMGFIHPPPGQPGYANHMASGHATPIAAMDMSNVFPPPGKPLGHAGYNYMANSFSTPTAESNMGNNLSSNGPQAGYFNAMVHGPPLSSAEPNMSMALPPTESPSRQFNPQLYGSVPPPVAPTMSSGLPISPGPPAGCPDDSPYFSSVDGRMVGPRRPSNNLGFQATQNPQPVLQGDREQIRQMGSRQGSKPKDGRRKYSF